MYHDEIECKALSNEPKNSKAAFTDNQSHILALHVDLGVIDCSVRQSTGYPSFELATRPRVGACNVPEVELRGEGSRKTGCFLDPSKMKPGLVGLSKQESGPRSPIFNEVFLLGLVGRSENVG